MSSLVTSARALVDRQQVALGTRAVEAAGRVGARVTAVVGVTGALVHI